MLSHNSKSLLKTFSSRHVFLRPTTTFIATYHHSPVLCHKKAAQFEQPDNPSSPLYKLTQGINRIKSTILNAPPLRPVTRTTIESLPFTGHATSWDDAVKQAQSLVNNTTDQQERMFDPTKVVGKDLWELSGNISKLLGTGHPFISTIKKHYLQGDTNRIRPLLVLLMAKATCQAEKRPRRNDNDDIDEDTVTHVSTLHNPILPTQRRLAEISEMIYTASLLHHDIIDNDEQQKVANPGFGNKLAVLAGDFLLARASLALAQLQNPECIELMATCIANLAEGEFMQLQDPHEINPGQKKAFEYYLDKVYMKTGSLIAQSCKASSVLAGCSSEVAKVAYEFGKDLGIALQLMDDVREFSINAANMETKARLYGWINAPVLLAWESAPELGLVIERNFSHEGDLEKTRLLVYQSSSLKKTLDLANKHIESAIKSINKLPESEAKLALLQLVKNLDTKRD